MYIKEYKIEANKLSIKGERILKFQIIVIKNLGIVMQRSKINIERKISYIEGNKIYVHQMSKKSNTNLLKKINFMLTNGLIKEIFRFDLLNDHIKIYNIIGLMFVTKYTKNYITFNIMKKNILNESNNYIKNQNKWFTNKLKHKQILNCIQIFKFYENNNNYREK